jgi:hypothetical protein
MVHLLLVFFYYTIVNIIRLSVHVNVILLQLVQNPLHPQMLAQTIKQQLITKALIYPSSITWIQFAVGTPKSAN